MFFKSTAAILALALLLFATQSDDEGRAFPELRPFCFVSANAGALVPSGSRAAAAIRVSPVQESPSCTLAT